MNVLVTGSSGFIGKHMVTILKRRGHNVFSYDINDVEDDLVDYISKTDYIVHLAGINRPLTKEEFYDGNTNFTKHLVDLIKTSKRNIPLIMSSSIQAELDNDYGISKKLAEDYLFSSLLPVYVYRLYNVFGSYCRPNYNSVVATFCYNIAHDLPISISDENKVITFNYVDDVCQSFISVIESENRSGSHEILYVEPTYKCSLKELARLLYYFKEEIVSDRHLPLIHSDFELKLFKTFCSYFSDKGYTFNFAGDNRGSFEELFKSKKYGQISENISFPNITKGGHYHTRKLEIFYVVKGKCMIRQRNIITNEINYQTVEPSSYELVNILPNWTHDITNISNDNSVTLMWISEIYDDKDPDTFKEDVK